MEGRTHTPPYNPRKINNVRPRLVGVDLLVELVPGPAVPHLRLPLLGRPVSRRPAQQKQQQGQEQAAAWRQRRRPPSLRSSLPPAAAALLLAVAWWHRSLCLLSCVVVSCEA